MATPTAKPTIVPMPIPSHGDAATGTDVAVVCSGETDGGEPGGVDPCMNVLVLAGW